ncbi:MAG: UPF0147 family protein [Candidatus Micrarchaeota archaeon]|nr:UPF0147 family protein [Candidatus Micrarchaeota archaeon]
MDDEEIAKTINDITKRMELLISDTSVPKNVRTAITEAKGHLDSKEAYDARISSAIYSIDAISNDINLPPQARTAVWGILSALESIKTSG